MTMLIVNRQKSLKVFLLLRTSLHGEKVDDLNKQSRVAATRLTNSLDQLAQTGDESIVPDAQQRTTRNITHARRLDDEHTRTSFSKSSIPIKVLLRDKAILCRAPRHHRRHPRPVARLDFSDSNRTEQSRTRRFLSVGPARLEYFVSNRICEFPHLYTDYTDYRDFRNSGTVTHAGGCLVCLTIY